MTALFSDRIDEPPDVKIIDVWICKMRRKLQPFGIEIKTCWGVGYEMPESSKAIAGELITAA
jgi:two-component system, cell cycle response regulator CtrA